MIQHNDISYEVNEEFSRIYITGPARALEKILVLIRKAHTTRPYRNEYSELFSFVERYQHGEISKKELDDLIKTKKETNLGGDRVMITTDNLGMITGDKKNIVLNYGCNGHDENFYRVKSNFERVLKEYI